MPGEVCSLISPVGGVLPSAGSTRPGGGFSIDSRRPRLLFRNALGILELRMIILARRKGEGADGLLELLVRAVTKGGVGGAGD